MPVIHLAIATTDHVPAIAARMRTEDKAEILASGGYQPEQALRESLAASEFARTAFVDGEPLAMFGVAMSGDVAIPWLLTTDAVCRHPFLFWKASKVVLRELREAYPTMVQFIDARYASAMTWARRLGFAVGEPQPFGVEGRMFHPIVIGGR
jgi:hypothetical protein